MGLDLSSNPFFITNLYLLKAQILVHQVKRNRAIVVLGRTFWDKYMTFGSSVMGTPIIFSDGCTKYPSDTGVKEYFLNFILIVLSGQNFLS
jgi:hypothetical protein